MGRRVTRPESGGQRTKKSQLERILQSLDPLLDPAAPAEQYPTPAGIAAEVAFSATAKGDIAGRTVIDLGCGNGVLAIAASLLGASRAAGVDSDPAAIEVARRNGKRARVEVEWRLGDVRTVREPFDTVLMNPPFGSQTRHADLAFWDTALARGRVVYSFLNAKSESFVRRHIESQGGTVTDRLKYGFPIRRMFPFHRKDLHRVDVVLYRVQTAKG